MNSDETELFASALSVGSVVKKIVEINPDLSTSEIIALIHQSIRRVDSLTSGKAESILDNQPREFLDEQKALSYARATRGAHHA